MTVSQEQAKEIWEKIQSEGGWYQAGGQRTELSIVRLTEGHMWLGESLIDLADEPIEGDSVIDNVVGETPDGDLVLLSNADDVYNFLDRYMDEDEDETNGLDDEDEEDGEKD